MDHLENVYKTILNGNMGEAGDYVQVALDAYLPPHEILQTGMISAMAEVGRLFELGDFYVPEMLISARAMKAGLEVLRPHLAEKGVKPLGKVVIGTVQGDLHDIGKNLVGMMLEGAGFEIVDLGTDVTPEKFVEAAKNGVDIIGLSVLLTTTMQAMENTIQAIRSAGLRERVKIIVGGAPVTAEFASQIGADGFAPDASQAATLANSLMA